MLPRRAIIIAAGMGRRLQPYTDHMPKCLVPVAGKPIMHRQLDAFRAHGIDDIVVIRGYRADVLESRRAELGPGVRFVENPDFASNNILQSLFKAEAELEGAVLLTYADIVFGEEVVGAVVNARADYALVVDRDFVKIYEGRTEHPLEEGEVSDLMHDGSVARVGKRALPVPEAIGEYIGLARLGERGVATVANTLDQLTMKFAGREHEPFQRALTYRNAYQTDLWQALVDSGVQIDPVLIDGQWREIDTGQDLDRARELVESAPKDWS